MMIEQAKRFSAEISRFFERLWEEKGVRVRKDSKLVDVGGER